MRKKYIIYAISLALIWVILVVKLKGLHYTWSRQSYRLKPPKIVEIGYFLRSYRLSIDEEPNNHHGEYGSAVEISEDEIEEKNSKFKIHQFNELASIKMPVLRKLPEKRRQSCFLRQYTFELPTASIIIIFHNEAFSTLIRTVHTAISRSPYHLVKEIILVDDFSDYEKFPSLLFPLEDHFKNTIKVKILRASERMGLTVSRLRGAKIAKGEVLVFLDSHCEAFDGWLEPLLYDIKKYPNFAITPIIETIIILS
ncbi:hypothetical protein MXB_4173 [Myxobolus squamalis]|nr:hypothetical protein MXB_4173 [Myxobolus squamalis]